MPRIQTRMAWREETGGRRECETGERERESSRHADGSREREGERESRQKRENRTELIQRIAYLMCLHVQRAFDYSLHRSEWKQTIAFFSFGLVVLAIRWALCIPCFAANSPTNTSSNGLAVDIARSIIECSLLSTECADTVECLTVATGDEKTPITRMFLSLHPKPTRHRWIPRVIYRNIHSQPHLGPLSTALSMYRTDVSLLKFHRALRETNQAVQFDRFHRIVNSTRARSTISHTCRWVWLLFSRAHNCDSVLMARNAEWSRKNVHTPVVFRRCEKWFK